MSRVSRHKPAEPVMHRGIAIDVVACIFGVVASFRLNGKSYMTNKRETKDAVIAEAQKRIDALLQVREVARAGHMEPWNE